MTINYDILPAHMQDGFRRYIERGIPGGSFMTAVLTNDLMGAFSRADDENRARLFDTCKFLHWDAPRGCHGSQDAVDYWIKVGGLEGLSKQAERDQREDA